MSMNQVMSPDYSLQSSITSPADVETNISRYLESRLKTHVENSFDIFKAGLVTSMFAMELVVHLEGFFDIEIVGSDLQMDNFRTVNAMVDLTLRLLRDNE